MQTCLSWNHLEGVALTAFIISNQAACTDPEGNIISYRETPKLPLEFYGIERERTRKRSKRRKRLKEGRLVWWKRKGRKENGLLREH